MYTLPMHRAIFIQPNATANLYYDPVVIKSDWRHASRSYLKMVFMSVACIKFHCVVFTVNITLLFVNNITLGAKNYNT